MSLKYDQRGFAAVEAILIVVILAIIGFTGYFVYHANKKISNTLNSSAKVAQISPPKKTKASSSKPSPSSSAVAVTTPTNTTYSKVPSGLQAAILAEFTKRTPGCVKNGNLVNIDGTALDPPVIYMTSGYATSGIGCDGGSDTLFVLSANQWQVVGSTQLAFKCSDLQKYSVPVALLALNQPHSTVQCDTGTTLQDYSG